MAEFISIRGARENNLKDVTLEIPKRKLTIFTGVSGSGKSSIVFDTLATEAQRQLYENFSLFIRNFLPKYPQPDADAIENLAMAVIVDQKRLGGGSHSTVGTVTDISTVLRLLFSRVGRPSAGPAFMYSFNDPRGACPECGGLGKKVGVVSDDFIDLSKSLNEGAIQVPFFGEWDARMYTLSGFFDNNKKLRKFTKDEMELLLHGKDRKFKAKFAGRTINLTYSGVIEKIERSYVRRDIKTLSERTQKAVMPYLKPRECSTCKGARVSPAALASKINGHNIADLSSLEVGELVTVVRAVKEPKAAPIVQALVDRLQAVVDIGLEYLSLNRETDTLSGGESQRIQLATSLGSHLVGALYVLDEPSIGLHPRDTQRLIDILKSLRDLGNTVLVVEHDPDTIRAADHVIDLGPGAGELGGKLLFAGNYDAMLAEHKSLTGRYLSGELNIPVPNNRHKPNGKFLRLHGATFHNLQNIDLMIPLGTLTVVTGVSGSGKSTLVHDVLYRALAAKRTGGSVKEFCDRLEGDANIREVVIVDQSPIGRTPRSNPATYLKAFDAIREVFAATPDAKRRGFTAGHFSFNVPGGRCETCQGDGTVTVEMQFLADVELVCEECRGTRFKTSVLDVRYRGKNVHEVLDLTAREALAFFAGVPKVVSKLRILNEIGLGYLRLGQSATTLSGGKAQRLKLAAHLARTENQGILYILDEPTTGLHFDDIAKLLSAFRKLLESGASLLVIEHNLDVVKSADWLIDLGPEGGDRGGKIIATGTPEQVARNQQSHTGRFLARVLAANGQAKRSANGASKSTMPSGTIASGAGNPPPES